MLTDKEFFLELENMAFCEGLMLKISLLVVQLIGFY